jgi:multiple sugar transport system ATP-binding protein
MAKVVLSNLKKRYDKIWAVNDVSLEVQDGQFVTLVGPSGCGKTTILRMIAGLTKPNFGRISIGEEEVTFLPPQRRGIAMVFQDYALFPHMNVWKNVAFGLQIQKYPKDQIGKNVADAIAMVGLQGFEERSPAALSGGQRQRVALARALALQAKVFLMDEPLSNLDAKLRLQVRTELKRIHKRVGTTTVYVTHDQVEAMTLSDSVVILRDGTIQQIGSPEEVYHYPVNKFVAGFIGSPPMNFLNCMLESESGKLTLQKDGFKIDLSPSFAERVPKEAIGKEVIMGIRPEYIYTTHNLFSGNRENFDLSNPQTMTVDVIEPMGSHKYLDLFSESIRILGQVSSDVKISPDEKIDILFDMRKAHLFDLDSEEKLTIDR